MKDMDSPYMDPKDIFDKLAEKPRHPQELYLWTMGSLCKVGLNVETIPETGLLRYSNLWFIGRKIYVCGVSSKPDYPKFMELYNLVWDFMHKEINETVAAGVPDWFKGKTVVSVHPDMMNDPSEWF